MFSTFITKFAMIFIKHYLHKVADIKLFNSKSIEKTIICFGITENKTLKSFCSNYIDVVLGVITFFNN